MMPSNASIASSASPSRIRTLEPEELEAVEEMSNFPLNNNNDNGGSGDHSSASASSSTRKPKRKSQLSRSAMSPQQGRSPTSQTLHHIDIDDSEDDRLAQSVSKKSGSPRRRKEGSSSRRLQHQNSSNSSKDDDHEDEDEHQHNRLEHLDSESEKLLIPAASRNKNKKSKLINHNKNNLPLQDQARKRSQMNNNNSNNFSFGSPNSQEGSVRIGGEMSTTLEALLVRNPSAEPALREATAILLKEERAKTFRVKLRFILAFLAVCNFIQTIIFFFLVAPPGMGEEAFQQMNNRGKFDDNTTAHARKGWDLLSEVGQEHRGTIFLSEGIIQLLLTLSSEFVFLLQFISRNPESFPSLSWVPRNAGNRHAGVDTTELLEALVWLIHCPIGLSSVNERLRYINGVCVFRLYVVIQAGMQMTDFGNTMMRTMANFFNLRLTAGVFLRWALEFHKWRVLIPSFLFMWGFMALCFSFAEGVSYWTSLWFLMTTMTTVGYGDIVPLSTSGRLVGLVGMCIGLVVLAYIVSQVQQLTTRQPHEQKVLDALRLSKLQGDAKSTAARLLLARYHERKNLATMSTDDRDVHKSKVHSLKRSLRDTLEQIRLLPPVFDSQEETMNEIRENVRDLKRIQKEQHEMIIQLTNIIKIQQQQMNGSNNSHQQMMSGSTTSVPSAEAESHSGTSGDYNNQHQK